MALSLIGILVWGLALRSAAPDLYALNGGALRSYAYFTWLRVVVVMGLATVAAIAAVWRWHGEFRTQSDRLTVAYIAAQGRAQVPPLRFPRVRP